MKKIISLVLVLVLALTAIGGTLAYFTDTDSADNTFTVGNVDIMLNENHSDSDWEGTEDYINWLTDQIIVPGETIDKIVTVENVDSEDAWVRVTIVVPADMTATLGTLPVGWAGGETLPNVYVFMGRLNAGTETTALLQSIKLNEDVTNQGETAAYHVPVLAEAVQITGFENNMYGAFETLATSNVKNYIDQYVANDAFKALKSGDIVTVAENTKLPMNLNNGVVVMGDITKDATKVELTQHPETGNYNIYTSGATFVNLHFTERLLVRGDATFVNCTFDKGLWMTGVTGNVSLVGCSVNSDASVVGLLIDGAADPIKNHGRVIVEKCTINASASIQGATSALYKDCTFGAEGWSWKQIRINCPTTIEACVNADSIANGGNYALRVIPAAAP